MKKFNELTKKELGLWEEYIQEVMKINVGIPNNLLRRCWEDNSTEPYDNECHKGKHK
jgi:hypothetical protein